MFFGKKKEESKAASVKQDDWYPVYSEAKRRAEGESRPRQQYNSSDRRPGDLFRTGVPASEVIGTNSRR